MQKFDLIVIGSGPAGEKAALQAALDGHSVCVIDKGPSGGAWVNTGTIPSKTLRESALFLAGGRRRGVMSDPSAHPTIRSFMALKRHLVARWRDEIEGRFRDAGVNRVRGKAHFIDAHTLQIDDDKTLYGEFILIATGSSPREVKDLPVNGATIQDSNSILALDYIPQSMIVLGGGVIACEYAAIFQALGVQVSLINGRDQLLGFVDPEIIEFLEQSLRTGGMSIRHNARPEGLAGSAEGEMELNLSDGTVVSAEMIFVALGRVPNTEGLNLSAAGIEVTHWGTIAVDSYMQTPVKHIYAAGDVIGFPSLASSGMEQGRLAVDHMFGGDRGPVDDLIPSGIFTIPEVSSVGMDEKAARDAGIKPIVGTARYSDNVRAPMLGDELGMVKLVADADSHRLLGASVVGNQATELIHFAMAVIEYGGTIDDISHFVFNLPSLSALFRQATTNMRNAESDDSAEPRTGFTSE